jgi:hypothetical protein
MRWFSSPVGMVHYRSLLDACCVADPPIAFVAYSSRDAALAQLIGNAVYVANGKSDRVRYETWVYNDIPGTRSSHPSSTGSRNPRSSSPTLRRST